MGTLRSRKARSSSLIVVSGPPCQGFSDAGPRSPGDARNEVLVQVARVIAFLRPRGGLVENVLGLRRVNHTSTVSRFRAILNRAGYHVYGFELNALDFGAPQRRRRMVYFILPSKCKRSALLENLHHRHKPAPTVRDVLEDLPVPPVRPSRYDSSRNNGSLPNHYAMKHSDNVRKKIAAILPGAGPLSYRKLDPDSWAPTLLSGHRAPPVHYEQPRSITVREALRLQGFPDDMRIMGTFANQMTQVTNAVPAHLGKEALGVLIEATGGRI